jgi:hypothetical protein
VVYRNRQQYYDAITASTDAGQSTPFIDKEKFNIQRLGFKKHLFSIQADGF